MTPFTGIDRVFTCETNALVTPPFPTALTPNGTVDLCKISIPSRRARNAFLVNAMINWSATFTPLSTANLETPGFAQITFALLRDGSPIFHVIETAGQIVLTSTSFISASTTFITTKLQHWDTTVLTGVVNPITVFAVRATDIILVPPLASAGVSIGTITAAAGAVTLSVEEVKARKFSLSI